MKAWLARWLRGRAAPAPDETRWVVLDAESSGLDAGRDRLLALAAVGLRVDWTRQRIAIEPADSFEVVLRQHEVSDKANILLHGIGAQSQREGMPLAPALAAFGAYVGTSPLLAFHAAFDRALLERHARAALGAPAWLDAWADIEHLCSATTEVRAQGLRTLNRSLDDWLAHFGLACVQRHQAAADALAEAELLLRIWPRVAAQCRGWRDVQRLAARQDWLRRQ